MHNHIKIIFAALVVMMLAACSLKEAPLTVPDDAQAGQLIGLEDCTYKHNRVKYAAECGILIVPENRNEPNARLIALPVIRVNALEDLPAEPIFWFAGGPGNSNMNLPGLLDLIENHDMVMVGYRGRDGSVVLECPEMAQTIKGVGNNLLSAESTAHFGQGITDCADRLQSEGVDLGGYSIPEVIEDMEAARKALGYERVNLFSVSYGTRVALIYSWMYPESLHRSVMVNVNPPGHFAWEPEVVNAQIRYDAELCKQDPECSSRTDDLAATIQNISHSIPERWLLIPIDPGKVRFLTHFMLFNRGTATTVFDAYLAAEEGDPSGLALMSMAFDFMIPSVTTWGHWAAMGSLDYDPARNWLMDMDPPNSILGSPTSLMVGAATQQSGGWPVAPMPDEFREVQPTAVKTLLVSGSIDYSTPSQAATEELQPALSNGAHVILSEFGHFNDVWGFQPEATRHLLATFFDSGEVDDSLFTYQQMDFHVGLGFPRIAKIGLAIVLLAIGGLFALIRFILRRRKAAIAAPTIYEE